MEDKVSFVFSGAGSKIPLHVGAIEALEESGLYARSVAGTSSGAIIASLYANGFTAKEMIDFVKKTDFKDIADGGVFSIMASIYQGYVSDGSKLRRILERMFGNVKFSDLIVDLYVVACRIKDSSMVVFSKGKTPNVRVVDAVMASTAVPLFFRPVEIDGEKYCDGGIVKNFPIDLAELGDVVFGHYINGSEYSVESFGFYETIQFLLDNAFNGGVDVSIKDAMSMNRKVIVSKSSYDLSFVDFSVSEDMKMQMVEIGYSNMKKVLEK